MIDKSLTWHILLLAIATLLSATAAADVHKCLVEGKFIYTDQECPADTAITFAPADLTTLAAGPVTYTGSTWLKDSSGYARAIEVGKKENLPVLIYGYTDWCGFCKKLEKTYFTDYDINQSLSKFIKVKLNPEHSSRDKQLFKSLGGSGYPTLFVQHPNQALQRIDDPFILLKNGKRTEVAPKTYLQVFQAHLKPYEKPLLDQNEAQEE